MVTERFNPVLGFLSVSTRYHRGYPPPFPQFQSRAGFSECLDITERIASAISPFQSRAGFSECLDSRGLPLTRTAARFNPVLGFLSVSTLDGPGQQRVRKFQSRAGFSECLDSTARSYAFQHWSFNPVLGFLSVSTASFLLYGRPQRRFNPVLGFLSVSTFGCPTEKIERCKFQSRAGFSECLDRILRYGSGSVDVSIPCWVF